MRSKSLLLLLLFVFVISAVPAHAQQFKLFDSPFMKSFGNWLSTPVAWPPIGTQDKDQVAPLAIIFVSIGLFTIIYALSHRIPIFNTPQGQQLKNLMTWFSIPVVGMAVTGTHFVSTIWGAVGFGSDISSIIIFFIIIILLIVFGKWGFGIMGNVPGVSRIGGAVIERAEHEGERAAGVIRGQASREERNLAQEAQLFQGVDNLERAGVRDAAGLERYINEMINLCNSGQSLRQIVDGLRARLDRLNATFNALVAVNTRATTIDTQLQTAITGETRRLQALMNTVSGRKAGAGGTVPPADAGLIKKYGADMKRRLNDARKTSINITANGPRLTALETQIRARLAAGLAAISNPVLGYAVRVKNARTEFTQAAALTSELVTIMTTIEREAERVRNDLMRELTDVNAEEHLAMAGAV